jgi:hypothetical protein
VADSLLPLEQHRRGDVLVRQAVEIEQGSPGLDVGYRFNIE